MSTQHAGKAYINSGDFALPICMLEHCFIICFTENGNINTKTSIYNDFLNYTVYMNRNRKPCTL